MAMLYKLNVLQALKEKGYNTNRLRKEKLIAEASIQSLRENKPISWANIEKLCSLLECKPGDLLDYVPDEAPAAIPPDDIQEPQEPKKIAVQVVASVAEEEQ